MYTAVFFFVFFEDKKGRGGKDNAVFTKTSVHTLRITQQQLGTALHQPAANGSRSDQIKSLGNVKTDQVKSFVS